MDNSTLGGAGIVDPSVELFNTRLKRKEKKKEEKNVKNKKQQLQISAFFFNRLIAKTQRQTGERERQTDRERLRLMGVGVS